MDYAAAIEHLYAQGLELAPTPGRPRRKFELAHMRTLCAALGDPQTRVPSVLIAGTNGKGSTAATLAAILTAAGYRTGLYTSPHLIRVNERIQTSTTVPHSSTASPSMSGWTPLLPIPDEDFARIYTLVDEACLALVADAALPMPPSFFERLTAIAFVFFAEEKLDILILEVGLGGRLDATNIVEPLVSVITDIALDHQEYLGDTITAIAREKCGILRENGVLVTLPQHQEANQAIGLAATALDVRGINAATFLPPAERNSPVAQIDLSSPSALSSFRGIAPQATDGADPFDTRDSLAGGPASSLAFASALPANRYTLNVDSPPALLEVDSPLPGRHQQRNIALAIATALELRNHHSYNITNAALEAGIRNTSWPGRLELIAPNLLLDVAHNPAGAWTLRSAIASLPEAQPRTLIFSCLRDKSLTEMSRILFPLFDSSPGGDPLRLHDHIILAPIASPRAAHVDDLLAAAHALGVPAHAAPHLAGALAQARAITPPHGLIVATGSVYLIGEVRELVLQQESVPA